MTNAEQDGEHVEWHVEAVLRGRFQSLVHDLDTQFTGVLVVEGSGIRYHPERLARGEWRVAGDLAVLPGPVIHVRRQVPVRAKGRAWLRSWRLYLGEPDSSTGSAVVLLRGAAAERVLAALDKHGYVVSDAATTST